MADLSQARTDASTFGLTVRVEDQAELSGRPAGQPIDHSLQPREQLLQT